MDKEQFLLLLLVIFLGVAIHMAYRLKRQRDEWQFKYESLVIELLTEILKQISPPSDPSTKEAASSLNELSTKESQTFNGRWLKNILETIEIEYKNKFNN